LARRRRLGVTPRARESTLEREGWELQRHRRAGVPPSPRLRRPAVALAEAGGPREHKKRFGQHFLEGVWVDKVIRAIDPKPDELFIEIGAGRGALTRPLVERARAVIAFEIDRDLAAALQATAPPTLTVIASDFLEPNEYLGLEAHQVPRVVRAAGNLPYYVASPILFKLVDWSREAAVPFADATVMLQREVADRLVAPPGGKEYGVLSVLIQHAAHVEIIMKLPPGAFRPAPKVHSALVRLQFHPEDPTVADRALSSVRPAAPRQGAGVGRYRPHPPAGDAQHRGVRTAGGGVCFGIPLSCAIVSPVSRSSRPVYLRRAQQPD